jgi:hypothetical protein
VISGTGESATPVPMGAGGRCVASDQVGVARSADTSTVEDGLVVNEVVDRVTSWEFAADELLRGKYLPVW